MNPIPDEALNSHIGILGKTGSGKTYTAKGLVERLLRLKRHVVIVDPTGAWYGLRTGFDVPIFGGRHGDVEISDKAGEAVAAVIVEQRTSAIVDLSLMSGAGQQRFMRGFAHRLRAKPLGALYLVIDEADEFLPQNVPHDQTNAFGDLKWMVRRGRLSGFRVMMITQRPAEIAKAVLTQIETLIAHRLTAPQDRKAIEEWVKGHHDPAEARDVLNSLASLPKGEAWVWAPDLDILSRTAMPKIETFDSSRTPEPGEVEVQPPALADLDLSAIRDALAVAEEPTPSKGAKAAAYPDLRNEVERLRQDLAGAVARAEAAEERLGAVAAALGSEAIPAQITPQARPAPAAATPRTTPAPAPRSEGITGAQQKVLDALAWWAAAGFGVIDRRRACIMAGYSPKASTFGVYISELVRAGLVEIPEPGKLALSQDGAAKANEPASINAEGVVGAARALLSPAEARVFDMVVATHPESIERGVLADLLGFSRSASTLGVYLSKIGSFGFIETGRGTVRAADWMFL
jgi:hypothetical protein